MRIAVSRPAIWAACTLSLALPCSPAAHAEDVASFYAGRTLNLIEGFNVGGGADLYTRLVAAHWAHHIPGHPNIIVHNMPGAGSMTAANHLFNVSPRAAMSRSQLTSAWASSRGSMVPWPLTRSLPS